MLDQLIWTLPHWSFIKFGSWFEYLGVIIDSPPVVQILSYIFMKKCFQTAYYEKSRQGETDSIQFYTSTINIQQLLNLYNFFGYTQSIVPRNCLWQYIVKIGYKKFIGKWMDVPGCPLHNPSWYRVDRNEWYCPLWILPSSEIIVLLSSSGDDFWYGRDNFTTGGFMWACLIFIYFGHACYYVLLHNRKITKNHFLCQWIHIW